MIYIVDPVQILQNTASDHASLFVQWKKLWKKYNESRQLWKWNCLKFHIRGLQSLNRLIIMSVCESQYSGTVETLLNCYIGDNFIWVIEVHFFFIYIYIWWDCGNVNNVIEIKHIFYFSSFDSLIYTPSMMWNVNMNQKCCLRYCWECFASQGEWFGSFRRRVSKVLKMQLAIRFGLCEWIAKISGTKRVRRAKFLCSFYLWYFDLPTL